MIDVYSKLVGEIRYLCNVVLPTTSDVSITVTVSESDHKKFEEALFEEYKKNGIPTIGIPEGMDYEDLKFISLRSPLGGELKLKVI